VFCHVVWCELKAFALVLFGESDSSCGRDEGDRNKDSKDETRRQIRKERDR
jgi:hypothetical protein